MGISTRVSVEIRGKKKKREKNVELGGDGDFGTREYGRWDGATRKERERERGQGIDFFLKHICTKIYCLFPESKIHYILFFRLISSSRPLLSHDAKGKEKRKRKEKENPQNAFSPSHPPSMRYIHVTQSPPSPGRFKPLYPAAAPHIHTPPSSSSLREIDW